MHAPKQHPVGLPTPQQTSGHIEQVAMELKVEPCPCLKGTKPSFKIFWISNISALISCWKTHEMSVPARVSSGR